MMKKLSILCLTVLLTAITANAQMRKVTNMDAGWRFHLGNVENSEKTSFNDAGWRLLNVPHDWSILFQIIIKMLGFNGSQTLELIETVKLLFYKESIFM